MSVFLRTDSYLPLCLTLETYETPKSSSARGRQHCSPLEATGLPPMHKFVLPILALCCCCGQSQLVTNWPIGQPIPDGDFSGVANAQSILTPITSITDLKVTLQVSGTWNGDLYCYLTHSPGFAVLLNRVGRRPESTVGYGDNGFNVTFDDGATNGDVHIYRRTLSGSDFTPISGLLTNAWVPDGRTNNPAVVLNTDAGTAFLSSFNGLDPNGQWVLFIADMEPGDFSTLDGWGLQISGTTRSATNSTQTAALQGGTYFGIWINGIVGQTYQIQYSSDLVVWTVAASLALPSSPYFWVDPKPMSGSRFYRAVLQP